MGSLHVVSAACSSPSLLRLQVHPDVDPSPQAAARFAEVKRAADVLLKGHQAAGPGPLGAAAAWREGYSQAGMHNAADWRPRSPRTALWFCAATLVGGFGVFYFALVSHEWLAGACECLWVCVCLWGRRQAG